ncbi:MAG: VPLPA-CTERM sorting domain-containing protein [Gammaproteobacteria bacterium]
MKSLQFLLFLLLLTTSAVSQSAMITQTVGGMDNLYFDDWGHAFGSAIGTGVAANSVSLNGNAFNFSEASSIDISATGEVVDNGITPTDANGIPNNFMDGNFRDLPVYSLIGIWSSTEDDITPVGGLFSQPFFIGTNLLLSFTDIPSESNLFLFLAENDGIFSDNSGSYEVNLDVQFVPLPAGVVLFMSGLLGLFATRFRRSS